MKAHNGQFIQQCGQVSYTNSLGRRGGRLDDPRVDPGLNLGLRGPPALANKIVVERGGDLFAATSGMAMP